MKKILLMMVALVATVTLYAEGKDEGMEGWISTFSPVTDKAELVGLHTAVAGDGSVYASSTYNKSFTFAEKAVTDPEGLTSSCIVKFDKDGNEKWAISLVGACTIQAMTADADGTLYVAGQSQDAKVTVTGTDGGTKEIENPTGFDAFFDEVITAHSAFIAKISKDGVVETIKTIAPAVNAEIAAVVGDPYDMGMEMSIYDLSGNDPMYVIPNKIMLDGDKVYVSASYTGDITELGWNGAYLNYFGMMIFDLKSLGVFSLNKSDLANAVGEANVQPTGTILYDEQYAPEAIDFVVKDGTVFVAFFGYNKLTLTTPAGSKDFAFETTLDESGNKEHALVLANAKEPAQAKVFHAAMNDNSYPTYSLVDATLAGDACILAGTFYGNFPLDNSVTKDVNTSFVASIKMADCSVNWAKANEVESKAVCMVVTGEEIKASTENTTYTFKTADGDLKGDDTMDQGFADAAVYNDQYVSTIYANEDTVCIFSPKMSPSTGVKSLKNTKVVDAKYFNANGMELSAPRKGLNIVKSAAGVKKVMK